MGINTSKTKIIRYRKEREEEKNKIDVERKDNSGSEKNEIFRICDQAERETRCTDKGQSKKGVAIQRQAWGMEKRMWRADWGKRV